MSQIEGALDASAPAQATNGPQQQGGSSLTFPDESNAQNPKPAPTTMQIAGHSVAVNPSGINVDGSQIQPGDFPVSVSGGEAIIQGNSIVIGSQIAHLGLPPLPPITSINGHVVKALPSDVLVDNNLLTPGGVPLTISGTAVSLDGSGHLYFGGIGYQIPAATSAIGSKLSNGAVVVPIPGGVSLLGTSLTAGGPGITLSGASVSLDASNNLIFDGTAHIIPTMDGYSWSPGQITTVNGQTLTELPNGVCISGTTIAPGAPSIIVSGTIMSLAKHVLIIGETTVPIALPTEQPLITNVGGGTITAFPSAISLAGTTLIPGASAITVSGTVISLNTAGALVMGSKTVSLPTLSGGLGSLILGGFGHSTTSSAAAFNTLSSSASAISTPSPQNTNSGVESALNFLPLRWLATMLAAVVITVHIW